MRPRAAAPPSLTAIAARVDGRLRHLLDAERARWGAVDPALAEPLDALRGLVEAGGKRLRPAFCHWGFVGAGGDPDDPRVVDVGAAFEMLHAFALVHDDVMDGSPTRRGDADHPPGVRRRATGPRGGGARTGASARAPPILVGDMAHVYADVLLGDVPGDVAAVWNELRLELERGPVPRPAGHRPGRPRPVAGPPHRPLQVGASTRSSGRCTSGAALAGRLADLAGPLSAYGDPLGEAFQLRDDVLGAFGDPAVTGKPVGEDLREGKPTPLLAVATERAAASPSGAAAAAVLARVGEADLTDADVAGIQQALVDTGALDEIEGLVDELTGRAVDAIEAADVAARRPRRAGRPRPLRRRPATPELAGPADAPATPELEDPTVRPGGTGSGRGPAAACGRPVRRRPPRARVGGPRR